MQTNYEQHMKEIWRMTTCSDFLDPSGHTRDPLRPSESF